jgi:hypothetical protein
MVARSLLRQERGSPLGQEYGDQIRAGIIRRALLRNERYLLAGVIVAAISALGSMIAANRHPARASSSAVVFDRALTATDS